MKKIFFLFPLVCFLSFADAQITIKSSQEPVPGENYNIQSLDSSVQQGAAGAGITWDFSSARDTLSSVGLYYVNPSTLFYSTNFPTATVANYKYPLDYFYQASDTAFYNLGYENAVTGIKYSKAEKIMNYPFTYLNKFSGSFAGKNFGLDTIRTGTDTVVADAYGKLIVPGPLTYNNVLRIQFKESYTDSFAGGMIHTNTLKYLWYDSAYASPVFMIIFTTVTGNVVAPEYSKRVYVISPDAMGMGIENETQNASVMQLFPNPVSSGSLTVRYTLVESSGVNISIYNLVGQKVAEVATGEQVAGMHSENLPVGGLGKGIYFVQMRTGAGPTDGAGTGTGVGIGTGIGIETQKLVIF